MSTSVQISRETVKKLTHPNEEIRLRTLQQLDAKVQRSLAHNEAIDFKPGELCKQLIRWFGCEPLLEAQRPLNLLLRILKSCYGPKAVEHLRPERFLREMEKVAILLNGRVDELRVVAEIQRELRSFTKPPDEEIIEIMDSMTLDGAGDSPQRYPSGDECYQIIEGEETQRSGPAGLPSPVDEFEQPWSKPTIADYNAMKLMADILINPQATAAELQNALQHLQITIVDYPPEYMLQSPNIYLNLLELYDSFHDEQRYTLEDVCSSILVFLQSLKRRLEQRHLSLAYRQPFEKDEILPRTQLKVEKTLDLLMAKSLKQLHSLIKEFRYETLIMLDIIEKALAIYRLLELSINPAAIEKLSRIVDYLGESLRSDDQYTVTRMKHLLTAFVLHDAVRERAKDLGNQDFAALEPLVRDYTVRVNYPERYEALQELLITSNEGRKKKFLLLQEYETAFASAVQLLKKPADSLAAQIMQNGDNLCTSLGHLKSFKLAEILLNAIFGCIADYVGNDQLKQTASDLLLKMLRFDDESLKAYVYEKVTQTVKKHYVCLMNGESFCGILTNRKLLDALIIGVPWCTEMIQQLVNDFQDCDNARIKQNCEDILVMFMKSQHLLGSGWVKLLDLMFPVFPLMQCCCSSKRIMELLLKLCDPDAKNLPFLQMLQGNCTFLFHPEGGVRSEALTRLMYMLNTMPEAGDYVPNIMEIGDLIPNDICLLKVPKQIARIFSAPDTFYDRSILHNLLVLLESTNIEPLIRKTTLMQLNVMCQNWDILKQFSNEGSSYITLQALESSLRRNSANDYTDSAIPAISILCKLLLFDREFRQELANVPNIYMLLLRSLFMYPNDIQVKEDATLCLFLLLFSSVLVVMSESGKKVAAPSVLANLQLPLMCDLKSSRDLKSGEDKFNGMESYFSSTEERAAYLRHFVAACFCGSPAKVSQKYLEAQQQYDIASELHLTLADWRLINASRPIQNLRRFLKAVANATDHKALINATIMLNMQLKLMVSNSSLHMPEDVENELFKMLAKYLQLPPGNESDYQLFEHMVALCDLCVRLPIGCVIVNFTKTLQADYHHACIVLLKHTSTPLRLYQKLCLLLQHLLQSPLSSHTLELSKEQANFYSNLFDLVFEIANAFFEKRELQRVRCLLSLLQLLSTHYLNMPDKLLGYYCKRFLNLSVALKSSTQTGAQWQRDCLQLICRLHGQMESPGVEYRFNGVALKYLSGLCGHNDSQVRALAWCILSLGDHEGIVNELSYLPGGFIACCLCTLLDESEVVLVRQLAGNIFTDLLGERVNLEKSRTLLQNQDFFTVLHQAVNNCVLTETVVIGESMPKHFTPCELISCYCRICLRMAQYDANFLDELCEKPFMFKLYELMKLPPVLSNPAYSTMCSDISQLYALYAKQNFVFLQNTLCRDYVWLTSFANLLRHDPKADLELVSVLNLLMVLCRDQTAYERLCEQIAKAPEHIVRVFVRSFKVTTINRPLQKVSLALLTYLLIKSQHQSKCDYKSFAEILESPVEMAETPTDSNAPGVDKENDQNVENAIFKINCAKTLTALEVTNCGSVMVFMDLFRLFSHLCPTKSCKFDSEPIAHKVQIAEALAVLLKMSPKAQEAAKNLKLFDKITRIFKIFLEEFNTSCTVFVRRYGETKKMAIINNFRLLLNILLNWFSAPTAVLTDELHAQEFTKVLIRIWSWLAHSAELKLLVLQVCAFLSDRSLIVCLQFSSIISSFANSILQLVIKIATFETTTVKAASSETFPVISTALRVIMNCCACAEGRVIVLKSHTLDIFDGLHPFNMKSPRLKPEILLSWLQFWELFSRYNEGGHARNLNSLCEVINRTAPRSLTRILSLKILRNMCFANSNRASLLASNDFVYTIDQIVAQPLKENAEQSDDDYSYEEQMLVSVAVWKLISGGIKFVSIIRGTKLAKKFRILREHLTTLEEEVPQKFKRSPFAQDLSNVLDIMFEIFRQ